ncbi:MAG: hypothetical protein IH628_14130 [Proteobacteria bacterium]|nr:hypothetical protein [Pseudomonadota bacterium]
MKKIAQFVMAILKQFPYIMDGKMYGIPSIKIDESLFCVQRREDIPPVALAVF